MMAADVLVYRANQVPVGEDQLPHMEIMRELARRFNYMYGREKGFDEKALASAKKLGNKQAKVFLEWRSAYQEKGDAEALEKAKALLDGAGSISAADRELLYGYLLGSRKQILTEPQALLTEASRLPGLDGQKMSKSYGNAIALRDDKETITRKIRTMQTDPARVKRTDPGDPDKCPVWLFHVVYSDDETKEWVRKGCCSAGIGCIQCKQPIIDAVIRELEPMQERAAQYVAKPALVREIVEHGCEKARRLAGETMRDVREAMGLGYSWK